MQKEKEERQREAEERHTWKTNTFSLSVSIDERRNCLFMKLEDYVNGAFYEGEYDEGSIGGEIHRNLEIMDVYHALENHYAHNNSLLDSIIDFDHLEGPMDYQFGQELKTNPNCSLQVSNQGVITLTCLMNLFGNEKKMVSSFPLTKTKSISPHERVERNCSTFHKEIIKVLINLQEKVSIVECENQLLKDEVKRLKDNNYEAMMQKYLIEKELEEQKMQNSMCWGALKRGLSGLESKMPMIESCLVAPVDVSTPNAGHFGFSSRRIVKKENNGIWEQLLMKIDYERKQCLAFKFKVVETQNNHILIGIIDRLANLNELSSKGSQNAASYYGHNGMKFPDGEKEEKGFKANDMVEVVVKFKEGRIVWKINEEVCASENYAALEDENKDFVPYLQLAHIGDCVEWMGFEVY